MYENEIIELQTRLAWQEDTLASLNEVIARQDQCITQLQQQMQRLQARLLSQEDNQMSEKVDERPPHY